MIAASTTRPILSVSGLSVSYFVEGARIEAVRDVSFELVPGETLALVGESAAGKTTAALATIGLLPENASVEVRELRYRDTLLSLDDEEQLRALRGSEIAVIFQDARTALTPTLHVIDQVAEVFTAHRSVSKGEAQLLAEEVLTRLLPEPRLVAQSFPFQLSGGMAQRVMIAMATALEPKVIIADEPTASLDAAIRNETLAFLEQLRDDMGVAVLLITHDLGVVARLADRVAVMYAGELVETADVRTVFRTPKHPYTFGLLSSMPSMSGQRSQLTPLFGQPPDLAQLPPECPFLPRCNKVTTRCRSDRAPALEPIGEGHHVACYNPIVVPLPEVTQPEVTLPQ